MRCQLEKNDVHIWWVHLDWPKDKLSTGFQLLSKEEQARAERFVQQRHRERYIASHVVLLQVLSRYVDCSPAEIRFYRNDYGKPYLANSCEGLNVQFNMSDSKDYALYGIALDNEVGVDLEFMKPSIEAENIAQRFFSPDECRSLLALPASKRLQAFYRCWTRKEAYIKVVGQGLSFGLNRFTVSLKSEGLDCLLEVDNNAELARSWSLGSLAPPEDYQAALAIKGKVKSIKTFEWSEA